MLRAKRTAERMVVLQGCLSTRLGVAFPDVERGDVGGKRIHPFLVFDVPFWL